MTAICITAFAIPVYEGMGISIQVLGKETVPLATQCQNTHAMHLLQRFK